MSKTKWPKLPGVRIPIYGGTAYLVRTRKKYNEALAFLNHAPMQEKYKGCQITLENKKDGGVIYLIGIFDNSAQTMVHECSHATFDILGRAGVPVENDRPNEAFCYMIDWLFGALCGAKKL